ncbi:MAG: hypothetical protein ACFCD0_08995 [Gemmataceae bacterium]
MKVAFWKRAGVAILTTVALVAVLVASVNLFGTGADADTGTNNPALHLVYPVAKAEAEANDDPTSEEVVLENWFYTNKKKAGGGGDGDDDEDTPIK